MLLQNLDDVGVTVQPASHGDCIQRLYKMGWGKPPKLCLLWIHHGLTLDWLIWLQLLKQRKQIAPKFVSRLRGLPESKVAYRGLATPNLRGYLGLRKGSDFLNVGNDLFPVHAASITAFR